MIPSNGGHARNPGTLTALRVGRSPHALVLAVLIASSLFILPSLSLAAPSGGYAPSPGPVSKVVSGSVRPSTYTITTVYYHSSVDNFLLSYYETIPNSTRSNSSHYYLLAVELHGLTGSPAIVSGGTGAGVYSVTAQAATQDGFILIDVNTRTGSGWYVNSNYTGPQEQDILDAIAHEQTLRHISGVYLFGTSMGSIGTLSIGLDHPKLFKGLGLVAGFTDFFEMYDYWVQNFSTYAPEMLYSTGGLSPNASAYARSIFLHLSPLRFHPQRLAGLRLYMANGAQDALSTNNLSQWPFMQANNTILNRTCLVATNMAEPPSCTLPVATLEALHPGRYHYRFIYEPNGPHSYFLLNASDMFAYFLGGEPDGTYWGIYPTPIPRNTTHPLVTVATVPRGCGSESIGTQTGTTGDELSLAPGNYSFNSTACGHRTLLMVRTAGGITYNSSTHSLDILQSGSVVAVFQCPRQRRGSRASELLDRSDPMSAYLQASGPVLGAEGV
jgi:pimeloyl-ACP methyl ester carboxylesterase